MANLLTDESRLARYSVLLKRKKRIETVFDIAMWVMLITALIEIIPLFFDGVLRGAFIGEMIPFIVFLIVTFSIAFFIFAVSRRDWRFILTAEILALVLAGLGMFMSLGILYPLLLLITLIDSLFWLKLSKEEGFPRFEISYQEEEEKKKVQERRTEYRTLQAEIREEQAELDAGSEMTDLLDADSQKEFMPAKLKNYHERYRNADAVVRPFRPHDGTMDQVDESDASGEMQEL